MILVTGPTGSGKTTTLCSAISKINDSEKKIVTLEDPIEFRLPGVLQSGINHRVGFDFARGLRSLLRQDPDIVLVGEIRDQETAEAAVQASLTGHVVFSTLHTNSASQTIHRIVDSFPSDQQDQIRAQLSSSLLGIVSQRLIPRKSGGLIPACEILKNNSAVSNLIRENKIHEIDITVETSSNDGMISLNKYLSHLVKNNEITLTDAINYSRKPKSLKKLID
jgi:twitching motility protein PilT